MASRSTDDPVPSLDEEARAWLRRLRSADARGRDARLLAQWCARSPAHRRAFARARQEWQDLAEVAQAHRRMFPEVQRHPAGAVQAGRGVPRRWFLAAGMSAAGVAAIVAAVRPPLGLWPSWEEAAADLRTGVGEQRTVAFSDAFDVMLNTRTSLALRPATLPGEARHIRLIAGEIAVRRGPGAPPVEVDVDGVRLVPDVGTVEVRRLPQACVIRCTDGRAALLSASGPLSLRAGERVVVDARGASAVEAVDMAQALAWRRGVVAFRNTPLPEAVDEINRYRAGRVVLTGSALEQRRLSGHFRIDALDEAIGQIELLFGARVTRFPAGLVMLG